MPHTFSRLLLIACFATFLETDVRKNGEEVQDLRTTRTLFFFFHCANCMKPQIVRLWSLLLLKGNFSWQRNSNNNSRKQTTDCITGHLHKVQSFIVPVSIYDKWMALMHNVWRAYETFSEENWASSGVNPAKKQLQDLEILFCWWNQQLLALELASPLHDTFDLFHLQAKTFLAVVDLTSFSCYTPWMYLALSVTFSVCCAHPWQGVVKAFLDKNLKLWIDTGLDLLSTKTKQKKGTCYYRNAAYIFTNSLIMQNPFLFSVLPYVESIN